MNEVKTTLFCNTFFLKLKTWEGFFTQVRVGVCGEDLNALGILSQSLNAGVLRFSPRFFSPAWERNRLQNPNIKPPTILPSRFFFFENECQSGKEASKNSS